MADDIAANGLRHRIILDPEGRVLDGRQRLAACQLAGVEPTFQVVDDDPFAVIFSMNALRQNVTTGQEAMSVALMLALDGKRRNGRWVRGSVETDGLDNAKSVTKRGRARQVAMVKAGAVLNYAPNLAKDVLGTPLPGRRLPACRGKSGGGRACCSPRPRSSRLSQSRFHHPR